MLGNEENRKAVKEKAVLSLGSKGFHTVRGYEILDKQNEALSHSMEDYLEMIYRAIEKEGYVRINTLAEALNVKAPSATRMVQKLGVLNLLRYEKYGIVRLTSKGEKLGRFLLERHNTIEKFLTNVGVVENLLINVELIEHNVTNDALHRIDLLNRFFNDFPDIPVKFQQYRLLSEKTE